ncbi:glycosyl hydrolase 108 family protein [Mucilaginibacter sp.]
MADFIKAYKITILGNEGGYNPGIGEKETYRGIDRGANPKWDGWQIIDPIKKNNPGLNIAKMNLLLAQNLLLQNNIERFYKTNYWDTISLDHVNDQQLADNLFDCSVNQGEGMARKFMQVACNYVMFSAQSGIKPLLTDKKIGPATLDAFNALPPKLLNSEINAEREASYRQDAGFAEWGKVWQKRLINYT